MIIECPDCRAPMVLRNSRYGKFWGCSRWPQCKATHGAHPNGKPLGIPGDDATKQARIEAHKAFDAWWKAKGLTRKDAYRELQGIMNTSKEKAHIGCFTIEQCRELIGKIKIDRDRVGAVPV